MPTEFSITHTVAFSETDMAGVVHFSNFFRMMEEVEHAFFRHVGLSVSMEWEQMHVSWPRVMAACEFITPLRFENQVELKLRITRLGEKSLSYEVDFLVAGQKAAVGKITSVCCQISKEGMKAIPIPQQIRTKIEAK
jgi:acyl-CoA thioester hydrolase